MMMMMSGFVDSVINNQSSEALWPVEYTDIHNVE